jgi:hypothetical protein
MKRLLVVILLSLSVPDVAVAQTATARTTASVKYGSNPAAGHTFSHDGVKLYYEIYGAGEPRCTEMAAASPTWRRSSATSRDAT